MSVPNTMRVGPFAYTVLVKKRYLMLYFLLIWISMLPELLEFWIYWRFLWNYTRPVHFYIFLPLVIFFTFISFILFSILFAKVLLLIVNLFHKPKEGMFLRDASDKDYRYWSIRNTIKRWPTWLSHKFPFPFLDNLCFRMFGVKTPMTNSLFEGWVDTEFIEFGKNVVVGQGALVKSSLLIGEFLIIRKTIIGDNVRIGAHSVILPGTQIGRNSIVNTWSCTIVGQELEEGWIYNGSPAKKFKKNKFLDDNIQDKIKGVSKGLEDLWEKYDKQYIKRHDIHFTRKERKEIKEHEKERLAKGIE